MKYTLKDNCKEWGIETIADSLFAHGMAYMNYGGNEAESKRVQDEKLILIKELKRRIK